MVYYQILNYEYYTALSAGFSIFVHWKVAEHGVHNLRPCTGFLFPVYSCILYIAVFTVLTLFYLQMDQTFPVEISLYRKNTGYGGHILNCKFFII